MSVVVLHNGIVDRGRGLDDTDRLLIVDGIVHEWDDAVAGEAVDVIDLDGRYAGPAFGDGHVHLLFAGRESLGPRITGLNDIGSIVDEVARFARANPGAGWIRGGSYDNSIIPSGLFDARWLDDAVADRPVVLNGCDYHTLWCNSRALEIAGINDATMEPALGSIPRHQDGSPIGVLMEWGATDLIRLVAPVHSVAESVEAIRRATGLLASRGVTWAQDAWVDPEDIDAWEEAARCGALNCRVDLALRADPLRWDQQKAELDTYRGRIRGLDTRLTCNTVKFFVDGVTENHTALFLDGYEDSPNPGLATMDPKSLDAAVSFVDRLGFDVHLHAIGDAAVRLALDALEFTQRTNPPRRRRSTIAHAQLIAPSDLTRFAELGAIACFQPAWAELNDNMTVLTIPHIGCARGDAAYPIGTMLGNGAPVSFGSDWPCTTADPFHGMRTAITRQTEDGHPEGGWTPHERISVDDALHIYRGGVAYQGGFEDRRGTLAVGMEADFVVLDRDPRRVDPHEMTNIVVDQTRLSGAQSWSAATAYDSLRL